MNDRPNVDQLVEQMQSMRGRLGGDARAAKNSIRSMTDWRQIVRKAPWKSIAVTAAVGYLLVPKRTVKKTIDAEQLEKLTGHQPVIVTREQPAKSIAGTLAAIIGAGLARVATAYVAQHFEGPAMHQSQEATQP